MLNPGGSGYGGTVILIGLNVPGYGLNELGGRIGGGVML